MGILAICGSPRKGNTEFMLKTVLDSAKGEKELILLREKNFGHCKGCLYCHDHIECTVTDDMKEINEKLLNADVIVLATPNYFDNVSGLMKDFIDRTHIYYKSKSLKGKRLYLLVVGGADVEKQKPAIDAMMPFAKFMKLNFIDSLAIKALHLGDIENEENIQKMKEFGEKIE